MGYENDTPIGEPVGSLRLILPLTTKLPILSYREILNKKKGTCSTMHLIRILMIHAVYPLVKEVTSRLLAEVDLKLFNI